MTTDKVIEFEPIKTQLLGTEAGKKFLDLWPTIYNKVIVADIATNVLSGFVESSGKVKSLFSKLSKEDAQTIEAKIQEAAEELAKRQSLAGTSGKLADRLNEFPELATRLNTLSDNGKAFLDDFANASDDVAKKFSDNPQLVEAWEAVIGNPIIRKDIKALESVNKILGNSNISSVINKSDLGDIVNKLAQKGVKCRTCTGGNSSYKFLDEILDDIEFGAVKYGSNYTPVLIGFKQGGNFAEGAMFVASSLKKYPTTFPKGTVFEFTEVTAGGVRRVDVKVSNTFYEFKSVATNGLPPDGFVTQFFKDLDLAEVIDLSQIKWWFDGEKISSLSKTDFLNAINQSTIKQSTINKLLPNVVNPTKAQLMQKISSDFNNIFLIR